MGQVARLISFGVCLSLVFFRNGSRRCVLLSLALIGDPLRCFGRFFGFELEFPLRLRFGRGTRQDVGRRRRAPVAARSRDADVFRSHGSAFEHRVGDDPRQ